MFRHLLTVLLLLQTGAVLAEKLTTVYSVTRDGQDVGETRETFERSNGHYRIESIAKPKGLAAIFIPGNFRIVSEGEITEAGLHPLHFENHPGAKPHKAVLSDFDWAGKALIAHFEGKTESQPLPDASLDRVSALYQLRYWPKNANEMQLAITNSGKNVKAYLYKRSGDEQITTPAGTFHTTRYTRERTPDDDGITIWVSDQLAAPIKIVIDEKKGAQNEQVLTGFQREP